MSDSNYSNRNDKLRSGSSKNESVFSWSNEYEAFSQRNSTQNNSQRSENYNPEDTIFMGRNQRSPRNNNGLYNNYGSSYHYDYPDEDYKYNPKSDFGTKKEVRSDYENSIYSDFMSGISSQGERKKEPHRTPQRNSGQPQKRRNAEKQPVKSEERQRDNQKSHNGRKNQLSDKSKKKKNTGANAPVRGSNKGQKNEKTRNKNTPQPDKIKKSNGKKAAKPKKKQAQMSKSAKKRAFKKARKERKKIIKNNRRIERLKSSGLSNDEIRAIMQREQIRNRALHTLLIVFCVLIGVAMLLGLAGVIYGFPAQSLKVKGTKVYTKDEIIAAGELEIGDNMLLVSQKKLSEKISTSLPYVKRVEIKRQFPDTLVLSVTETADKLLFVTKKGYICTDEDGKVTSEKKQAAKKGKIKIEGLESQDYELGKPFVPDEENGNKKKYELVKEIIAALEACEIKNCNSINVENSNLIVLECGKQMKIYLDSHVDFEYKLSMLSNQLKAVDRNPSGSCYYDLRFSGQIVYREGELSPTS